METPLYQQIKEDLLAMISQLSSNSAIPSERALAEKFKVSRMTLRKAINELVDEGVLYRNKTRGTFVSEKELKKVNSLRDKKYERHLLYMTRRNFKEVAATLQVPEFEDIIRIVCRNDKEDKVALIEEIFISKQKYFDEFKDIDKVFEVIDEPGELHISQSFYPMIIPVKYSNIMELPMDTPIIMVHRLYRTKKGDAVFVTNSYYNPLADTMEISF